MRILLSDPFIPMISPMRIVDALVQIPSGLPRQNLTHGVIVVDSIANVALVLNDALDGPGTPLLVKVPPASPLRTRNSLNVQVMSD